MDFAGDAAAPSAMVCGRPIAAAAVGQAAVPGQLLTCRNQIFEIIELGPRDATTRKTPFKTHCASCHAEDPMSLIAVQPPQEGPWPHAAQVPALMQARAQPGMLVCPSCSAYRFFLQDDGNEIKARCAQCKLVRHFGFEGQATEQRAPRSFAKEAERNRAAAEAAAKTAPAAPAAPPA